MSEIIKELHPDSNHARQGLQMITTAVINGWDIPTMIMREAPKYCAQILVNGDNREKLRAMELINRMRDSNINAIVAMDRISRLDDGKPTEIYTLGKIEI